MKHVIVGLVPKVTLAELRQTFVARAEDAASRQPF